MRIRAVIALTLLALTIAFVAANWAALSTPAEWSLLVTNVQAPVGAVMLALAGCIVFAAFAAVIKFQLDASADARRAAAELRAQRDLADQSEASRFTELRKYLELELTSLRQEQRISAARVGDEVKAATNSLSAYIGEMDDRLARQGTLRAVAEH